MRIPDPVTVDAGPTADLEPEPTSPYWQFYAAVAAGQVQEWLPDVPGRVLDVSGERFDFTGQLLAAGHEVVQVLGPMSTAARAGAGLHRVRADAQNLAFVRDASIDAILAEGNALSLCLAAELTAEELLRVLRPGGRLLLVVDSLLLGLARLADQERWAELADVPAADVVLICGPGGHITRCFWPEELESLLTSAGFTVDWLRPRSVLTPAAVERALTEGSPGVLSTLVTTELALARKREGASTGMHLVASARRPL